MDITKLPFKKLSETAVLPTRGSEFAAAVDLYASVSGIIPAHGFASINTGVAVAIPHGYYGRIAPRSGLSAKNGIFILGGVIDSDYRGELIVVLANHSEVDYEVKLGDRIAQMILEAIITPEPVFVDDLEDTARGDNGFGSTGN